MRKTGQNNAIIIEKTGQLMYCIIGGRDLCIEKTPLR